LGQNQKGEQSLLLKPNKKVGQVTVLEVSELLGLLGFENWNLLSPAQPHE